MLGYSDVFQFLIAAVAIMLAIILHELAHGYVALWNGDATAKVYGRLTLNPMAHFDPMGLVMLLLVRFGYAKPVPINPDNFRRRRLGLITVALAGITLNLLLAFFSVPFYLLCSLSSSAALFYLGSFFSWFIVININLAVFNILPIYPLDGFRLYDALIKKRGKVYYFLRNNSLYILLAILILGFIGDSTGLYFLDFVGYITDKISWLIIKLWSLII
mgnify:CR=1 FL=1